MKKISLLIALLFACTIFAQTMIPQKSSKGTITTVTNLKINYKNLVFEKGKLSYTNADTDKEEFLYENSIKAVDSAPLATNESLVEINSKKETEEVVNDQKGSATVTSTENANSQKTFTETVKEVSTNTKSSTNYLTDPDYIKGKKLNNLGTAFVVGGGACFLVGGILNLSKASKTVVNSTTQVSESTGSPVPLIIGLAGAAVGVVMKISGHSQMKKAKKSTAFDFKKKNEYFVIANNNGLGMKLNF